MTTESPRPDSHAPAAGTGAGFQRFVDGYRAMPMAERILGAAATAFLLGFIFNNLWDRLFKFGGYYGSGWFITLGFFGSVSRNRPARWLKYAPSMSEIVRSHQVPGSSVITSLSFG